MSGANAARAPPKTAAVIAAGILLMAAIPAYVLWDDLHSGDWPLAALPALLDDAFEQVLDGLTITATDQLDDDGSRELAGAASVATFEIDGHTYAAVAAQLDHGVQILNIADPSDISATDRATESSSRDLFGASGTTTFKISGYTYAAVAATALWYAAKPGGVG